MKLKRFITGAINRLRTVFLAPRKPKRNYFRKPGQPCIPETLMECISEVEVASIGDSYRRTHPEWTADSAFRTSEQDSPASSSFRKRRHLLSEEIAADFTRGNLVQIQGWVLAQTEAEQCARLSAKPSS